MGVDEQVCFEGSEDGKQGVAKEAFDLMITLEDQHSLEIASVVGHGITGVAKEAFDLMITLEDQHSLEIASVIGHGITGEVQAYVVCEDLSLLRDKAGEYCEELSGEQNAEDWMSDVELWILLMRMETKEDKLRAMPLVMQGKSKAWFERLEIPDRQSWKMVRAWFIQVFKQRVSPADWDAELKKIASPFTLGAGDMHEEDDWGFDDPMLEVDKDTEMLVDVVVGRIQVRRELSILQRKPMAVQEVKESEAVSFEVEKQVKSIIEEQVAAMGVDEQITLEDQHSLEIASIVGHGITVLDYGIVFLGEQDAEDWMSDLELWMLLMRMEANKDKLRAMPLVMRGKAKAWFKRFEAIWQQVAVATQLQNGNIIKLERFMAYRHPKVREKVEYGDPKAYADGMFLTKIKSRKVKKKLEMGYLRVEDYVLVPDREQPMWTLVKDVIADQEIK
ncbi:hypothetical protein L7F22_000761 [Adiantum nelumboides]|nr:hypothetical protein [Adiantum nelumboides]